MKTGWSKPKKRGDTLHLLPILLITLTFFAAQMGPHFYNQALADVLKGFDQTVETFTETVYGLEKDID